MASRRSQHYTKLSAEDDSQTHFIQDAQQEEQERQRNLARYKRKVVLLSIGLSAASMFFMLLAYLYYAGHHRPQEGAGWGFLLLAGLTGIPGFYGLVIVYGAWQRWPGYSYTDLPLY